MEAAEPLTGAAGDERDPAVVGKPGEEGRLHDDGLQRQPGDLLRYHRAHLAEVADRTRNAIQLLFLESGVYKLQVRVLEPGDALGVSVALVRAINLCRYSLRAVGEIYTNVVEDMIVLWRGCHNTEILYLTESCVSDCGCFPVFS